MRTFWITTLVLVIVLVAATAASAGARDGVAALVGAGSGDSSGDGGGTFTVKALKSGGEPDASEDAWAVKNANEPANSGEMKAISFGPAEEPAANGDCDCDGDSDCDCACDCDCDRTGDEIAPVGPEAEVQPDEPAAEESSTKKADKSDEAE